MAGSRTLKLSILADVDDLKKKLATANGDVEESSGRLEKFGKMAGAAFAAAAAAAAAYAAKIAIDGVKAAIEDQAAQERLARTLEATTGATREQIKAVEDQITKTQLATGVADDQLRPALSRLTIATSDLKKSQELLNLALDISAATGKPLEAVTNALAKSYEGSNTALSKLGVGLSAAELKTMSFQQVQQNLTNLFGGAAATQAETYQGQIARLTQRFNETKESIGTALLPIIQKMMDFVLNVAIPKFQEFKEAAIDPIVDAVMRNKDTFMDLYNVLKTYVIPIILNNLGSALKVIGAIASGIVDAVAIAIRALEPIINAAIDGINLVIRAINLVKPGPDIASVGKINFSSSTTTSASQFVKAGSVPTITTPNFSASVSVPSSTKTTAADTSSQMATVGEAVQNATVGVALSQTAKNALPTIQNYINVTGAIDPESTARQIIDLLNQSDARGTGGAGMLRYNTQMTSWNPVWRVKIAGTTYTSYVVNSLTVSSGRTDIYSQPNAGYCNVELLNYDNIPYSWSIGSTITVEVQNSSGTYVSLFGGYITDITTSVGSAGSIKNITRINVIAAGALSKLPKQITTGILSQDYDGNQIYSLLAEYLLNSWNEVATTQQWSTYRATTTWANAENIGLGEVDRPGTYTMENRASNNIDIYSLAAQIAASGLGYLYEDSSGNTCYASATHRQDYLATNGYTTLDANTANFQGIRSTIRSGDVRNKMIINYANNFGSSVTSQDSTSQLTYGVQGESINSYVHSATDAQSIADRYISLRKEPNAKFDAITFAVQNPEISDATRNKLLTIFMGMPIRITNLPLNISDTQFEGYVEGWTFRSSVNGLTITISASPIVYSQIALNWSQVSGTKAWNGLSGTLTWEKAIGAVA